MSRGGVASAPVPSMIRAFWTSTGSGIGGVKESGQPSTRSVPSGERSRKPPSETKRIVPSRDTVGYAAGPVPIGAAVPSVPLESKGACHRRAWRTNTTEPGAQRRETGASGAFASTRRAPESPTIAVSDVPPMFHPALTIRSSSEAGLHCGLDVSDAVQSICAASRRRVCAGSDTSRAPASTMQRCPFSSGSTCTNARYRPSGEYAGCTSRPGRAVIRRVARSPVGREEVLRVPGSRRPRDLGPSADQHRWRALGGTLATARGAADGHEPQLPEREPRSLARRASETGEPRAASTTPGTGSGPEGASPALERESCREGSGRRRARHHALPESPVGAVEERAPVARSAHARGRDVGVIRQPSRLHPDLHPFVRVRREAGDHLAVRRDGGSERSRRSLRPRRGLPGRRVDDQRLPGWRLSRATSARRRPSGNHAVADRRIR